MQSDPFALTQCYLLLITFCTLIVSAYILVVYLPRKVARILRQARGEQEEPPALLGEVKRFALWCVWATRVLLVLMIAAGVFSSGVDEGLDREFVQVTVMYGFFPVVVLPVWGVLRIVFLVASKEFIARYQRMFLCVLARAAMGAGMLLTQFLWYVFDELTMAVLLSVYSTALGLAGVLGHMGLVQLRENVPPSALLVFLWPAAASFGIGWPLAKLIQRRFGVRPPSLDALLEAAANPQTPPVRKTSAVGLGLALVAFVSGLLAATLVTEQTRGALLWLSLLAGPGGSLLVVLWALLRIGVGAVGEPPAARNRSQGHSPWWLRPFSLVDEVTLGRCLGFPFIGAAAACAAHALGTAPFHVVLQPTDIGFLVMPPLMICFVGLTMAGWLRALREDRWSVPQGADLPSG